MKTKGILIIVTVLLLMILTSVQSVNAESFESGFDGWEPFSQAGGTVQLSTTYVHSGTYSVEQIVGVSSINPPWPIGATRRPVASDLDTYRLEAWVYVTQRSEWAARSFFGFVFGPWIVWDVSTGGDRSYVGWDVCATSQSFFQTTTGNFMVNNGLTLNTWHNVTLIADTSQGTVSLWADGSPILVDYPAFTIGEKPTYYYIDVLANWYDTSYIAHHYIDDVIISEPSQAVGGEWISIDTLDLLAPWISLVSTMAIAASFVGIRRIKKRKTRSLRSTR